MDKRSKPTRSRLHRAKSAAGLAMAICLAQSAGAQPAGVSDFTVEIPAVPGVFGITHVAGYVTFTDDPGSATVRITNEHGIECELTDATGGGNTTVTFNATSPGCSGNPAGSTLDSANFTAPASGLTPGDPQAFRYRFDLFPNSNIDLLTPGSCSDTSGSTDSWTIAVDTPGLTAASVCLISFDRNVTGAECGFAEQEIQSENPAEVASVLINGSPAIQFCGDLRPATDVMLVLDRSGSMDGNTLGSVNRPKFAALRDAVTDFVGEWTALRSLEASPPADNIGMVFFDGDEANPITVPLAGFVATSASVVSEAQAECDGPSNVDCSGSTSIGDGLQAAANQLATAGGASNRKAILLMSDGKENTASRVTFDNVANPTEVRTYESDINTTDPLFGPGDEATIYSVTVGTSTAVSADLNEDLARATGGFYVNTEDDQEFVRPFFLEILENVLRFNSWQTLRLASGTIETQAPLEVRFPVSTTTRAMTVNLLWDRGLGRLNAALIPPGYSDSDALTGTTGPGFVRFALPLPLDPAVTPDGEWVLRIRTAGVDGDASGPLRREVPFHVSVTGDDNGLHGDLAIASANYTPGDGILVTARIDNPGTLTDLGASPRIEARILQPGEPIGNVIAASDAPGDPSGDDPGTTADAKLETILAENPDALKTLENTVALVDDGTGGDETAGDGVFSGTVPTEAAGHYTALITVEGQSERSGRFSREAQRSVHVRAVPDEVTTDEPQVSTVDGITQVVLGFSPKTAFGHAMPGFAPYFPVTATGIEPVIPRDNLDGTYTATLNFADQIPGDIAINWIESSANLNGLPASSLPISGNGRVLVTGFDIASPPGGLASWFYIVLLLLLVLLVFVIRKLMSS